MNLADLQRLREGAAGCPSEVMLQRLRAGELSLEQQQTVQSHVDGCTRCAARLAQQAAGFHAFAEADPVRMLAAIRRAADGRPNGTAQAFWTRWPRWWRAALAPLGALTAAAVVLGVMRSTGVLRVEPGDGLNRLKGGPTLHVFHPQNGTAVEALSGERLMPGEALQFTVDLPQDSLVRIMGVEANGTLYSLWPPNGAPAFESMQAGGGHRIPGAFTLDEAAVSETFYVIACTPRSAPPTCQSQGADKPPSCSEGCQSSPFVVHQGS